MPNAEACARAVIERLEAAGTPRQTTCTTRGTVGFAGSKMPRPSGQCQLLDGTVILASGEKDVMGDPIQRTITVGGHQVTWDAMGVAAVRLDSSGAVAAIAAGGLKTFECGDLRIEMPGRADVALWRDLHNKWRGVLQGYSGPLPEALAAITSSWTRLKVPRPLGKESGE